jgi:hypothetical protein
VYVEFWTHASRRPELRRRVAEQHERLLDTVGGQAVVMRESAPAETPARVRAALARELRDAGAVPPPIEVTPVPGSTATPATAPSSSSSPAKPRAKRGGTVAGRARNRPRLSPTLRHLGPRTGG